MQRLLLALALLSGCAGASEPGFEYSDTYGVPDACTVRTTAPELELLRCSHGSELVDECPGGSQAELWTRPGAEATPYGVTGRLELTCRSE